MKRIVLCADDYGQAPFISTGIRNLVENNRLTAVSCMVNTQFWEIDSVKLLPFRDRIDIGLHFNLTQDESLLSLILKSHTANLSQSALEMELNNQIDAFEHALGFLPDYIDGHQHVHHMPIIRDALLAVYQSRLKGNKSYIRSVNIRLGLKSLFSKKAVIYATGVRQLEKQLVRAAIPHNTTFSGIYGFQMARTYPALFRQFLTEVADGGLIMCHPGLVSGAETDAIAEARFYEYNYLISDQFRQDLASQGVELGRMKKS